MSGSSKPSRFSIIACVNISKNIILRASISEKSSEPEPCAIFPLCSDSIFAISLILTIVIEVTLSLIIGLRGTDNIEKVILVNILTNPLVVTTTNIVYLLSQSYIFRNIDTRNDAKATRLR